MSNAIKKNIYFILPSALFLIFLFPALLALPVSSSAQTKPDWKETWGKVLADAKKEGKVVVFGPPGEFILQAFVEGFKKAYPDIELGSLLLGVASRLLSCNGRDGNLQRR